MTKLRIQKKTKCPCCGSPSLTKQGNYEICPICHWEDDPIQSKDKTFSGGANTLSLIDARAAWQRGKNK